MSQSDMISVSDITPRSRHRGKSKGAGEGSQDLQPFKEVKEGEKKKVAQPPCL